MKAMILAAGRGSRLRPLTDTMPKPLVEVGERSLIEHHLHNLKKAGIKDVVINISYLGDQIKNKLQDGSQYDLNITYSPEPEGALETGGGVFNALSLLGEQPFIVINSDFFTDYPFEQLPHQPKGLAHLVLVDKPHDARHADFAFYDGHLDDSKPRNLTFAGISVYRPEFFANCQPGKFSLTPLLRQAQQDNQLTAEYYPGLWNEVGTAERLKELKEKLEF